MENQSYVTMFDECPVCGGAGTVSLHEGPFETKYGQVAVRVEGVASYRCSSCEEEFFTREQSRALDRAVKGAARVEEGLLSPERIVALRKRLGLSQVQLEEVLGVGEKVVTRWENGRVLQARATDDLLRLLERKPELVDLLRELRREAREARQPSAAGEANSSR